MNEQDIRLEMAYSDYAVLIFRIEGERYFCSQSVDKSLLENFTRSNNNLAKECARYRSRLQDWLGEFRKTNEVQDDTVFANFLFNPACFMAFGDNDNISIVATDDIDMAETLPLVEGVAVRQTCLAFCPTLDSLGLAGEKTTFCEIEDICDGPPPKLTPGKDGTLAARHPFLRDCPLIGVTYYKLNGMAVLGPGLLMQQAMYKAMAKKIKETLKILMEQTKAGLHKDIISPKDVESFRCAFLDPQGWCDVVTLMFCRNYSVIFTILTMLRSLTFAELYDTSKERALKRAVEEFEIHRIMAEAAEQATGKKVDHLLRQNHAFCSTFTTLGLSHEAFEKDDLKEGQECYYNGVVIADTKLNLCSGHIVDAANAASKKYQADYKPTQNYVWNMVGHNDSIYQQLIDQNYDADTAVNLVDLVKQIKSMRDSPVPGYEKIEDPLETHVVEGCTDLRIPMPIVTDEQGSSGGIELSKMEPGHLELRFILDELRRRLFKGEVEDEGQKANESPQYYNVALLRKSIKKMRIPSPLSRSIIYLYSDFARSISDPFLFDSIVDLCDIFTAVYRLLAKRLPETLGEEKKDYQCRAFLSAEDIENLVELIELMESALAHRVQIAFREAERWNITVDVRGVGLDRILNAADATLKCGLGILRRVMDGETGAYSNKDLQDNKSKIGGASNISFNPRSLSKTINIGDNPDFFLESMDLNIAHLTRPRAFYIHFHEAAHSICSFLREKGGCKYIDYNCSRSQICHRKEQSELNADDFCYTTFERYEEVFVEMLVHQFLFGNDHKLYFRNYLANYSFDPIAYCRTDDDTFIRMFEVLIRGFLITDPFHTEVKSQQLYSGNKKPDLKVKEAYQRFKDAVEDAGPFFPEFERIWNRRRKGMAKKYFKKVYVDAYHPVCCILDDVRKIYDGVCKGNEKNGVLGTAPDSKDIEYLLRMINEGLKDGRPLVRVLYKDQRPNRDSERYGLLDPFFLITNVLREHIKELYGEETVNPEKHKIHLDRDSKGEPIQTPLAKGKKLHRRLIDCYLNDVVSVDPDTRKKLMRNRVTVIKTIWGISTNLRARRLKDVFKLCGWK